MDFFIATASDSIKRFKGSVLLLPQPSLGSLPQLACDLLIYSETLKFEQIGHLGLLFHVPAVSGVDHLPSTKPTDQVSFACSVYHSEAANTTLVLPRSPVMRHVKDEYLKQLQDFIERNLFSEVLVLTSVDAATRGDMNLQNDSVFRSFLSPSSRPIPQESDVRTRLGRLVAYATIDTPSDPTARVKKVPFIPTGGLTRRLLQTFTDPRDKDSHEINVPVSTLLVYAQEGNNREISHIFARLIAEVLGKTINNEKLVEPVSWEKGLMGNTLSSESSIVNQGKLSLVYGQNSINESTFIA